jgi:aspartate aminotransferase-like enzyme
MRCSESALSELSSQVFSHRSDQFRELYSSVMNKVNQLLGNDGVAVPLCASGTGGNEFMLSNLIDPSDKVLCLINGYFSDRLFDQARIYAHDVDCIRVPWGDTVTPDQVSECLKADFKEIVCVVSSETSTGAWTDIEGISKICKEHGALLVVDHVSGVGNPLYAEKWRVAALSTTTHESFAAPPGVSVVAFSKDAIVKSQSLDKKNLYFNLPHYIKCIYDRGEPPFTLPTTLFAALDRNLTEFLSKGVEGLFRKYEEMAVVLREGLVERGYPIFTNPHALGNTLSAAYSPYDSSTFILMLKDAYGIEFSPGKGEFKDKIMRICHSGVTTMDDINYTLDCLSHALKPRAQFPSLKQIYPQHESTNNNIHPMRALLSRAQE